MVNNYAASKRKLVGHCPVIITVIIIFSVLLGLSFIGTVSVTAGSISSYQIVGQELEGEEQQLQRIPKSCSSSGAVTDGTNAKTTTGIVGANTTSSIYENPEYGIQILCPENWVYSEEQNPLTGDFHVTFMSLTEAQEFGRA
jgi:hypothetical protein